MKNQKHVRPSASAAGSSSQVTRREFLKRVGLLGGGIVVYVSAGDPSSWARQPVDFNAYFRIGPDGRVTCFTGKIEMGQGVITSLAQMLADELVVPLASVDMVMGDTLLCPYDRGTFGSLSTPYFGVTLRQAAAEARAVLIQMAAEKLKVPSSQLTVKDGQVIDSKNPNRSVTYVQLTGGEIIERRLKLSAALLPASSRTISGWATGRTDARQKVTGEARYSGDIRLPGMLYAKILRPPAHDAVLRHINLEPAQKRKGVVVIRDGNLIATLHRYPDEAQKALDNIITEWNQPEPQVDHNTIFKHLLSSAPPAEIITQSGNIATGRNLAAQKFEATYLNHYVAHAPMEPHTAVVRIEGQKATVWASTQTPFWAQQEVARTLGLATQNVRVITPFVGGGFGGKTRNQQVIEAARLAKLAGKPVQVAWTRKEEFFYDTFRPAAVIKIRSGLDRDHRIAYWDYDNYFAGSRSSRPFYDIPHQRVAARGGWMGGGSQAHPFSVGAWRGPGSNTNVFAMESQIDVMAAAGDIDPLTFRLNHLTDERMRKVLKAAAEKFGHRFASAPTKRGFGIACTDYKGTYVATMAEVKVDQKSGVVRVQRVVCAQDTGEVVNPDGVRLQIEGCITMGLGYVLSEKIRFRGGKILDENFDTYELPRFSWLPEIETVLVDNPGMPPQGCGEPAITPMGAVIANAVYDAIGVRLYELPMTPARVHSAIMKNSATNSATS
ncbi:MAG: molybdopterin-dependent oxidoreductase [Desulfobacterales bacterium]|jgi:CO/xanthine dehydrogenase Mo-binding subunit